MLLHSTDQLGSNIEIEFPPKRIISLVPSQTEFLFDIGLDEKIMGITRFCIHPADKVHAKTKIGGTKKFNIERIKSLNPDLIIGNKEENYEEGINELHRYFPVWMSDIFTLSDSFAMMNEVGRITGRQAEATGLADDIKAAFNNYTNSISNPEPAKSCAYFIWRKPYMVAAGNTFIDEMLTVFGLKNVFSGQQRYHEINPERLAALHPDYVFLSSEPYSFSEKHIEEFQAFAPNAKVVLADGEMFSWYGSRLRFAPAYFSELRKVL
jgi:ABC-type Fe3+-hydroxamate transport system substrate-binding protein